MAPFLTPKVVLSEFKEKIDSLVVQGDRIYLGTATGNLHIYSLGTSEGDDESLSFVEVRKNLTRRSIEQLGFVKDVNSLVVLSESTVSLLPLPSFAPPTVLAGAKANAFSFGIHSCIQHVESKAKTDSEFSKPTSIPTLITHLVVGCRRKVIIYSWKDGDAQDVKECPLPHSPRVITFIDDKHACFAYSATEYAVFSIPHMSVTDVSMPAPTATAPSGMGALTGLTGYMTLGLGAKVKPAVIQLNDTDTLIVKENEGIIIGKDAKPSKSTSIQWPVPPEEIAFVKPYFFSVLPPGAINTSEADNSIFNTTTVVQIRSAISLLPIQAFQYPFNTPPTSTLSPLPSTLPANATARLLTSSPSSKSPLFLVTTPTERAAAAAEGSSIWQFTMRPWTEQIDELVLAGQYSDALKLLDTIEPGLLPDGEQRRIYIRALDAVSQFRAGQFDTAIDTFIELNVNPAKVVALYPESISGRLSVPPERWIALYGGPVQQTTDGANSTASINSNGKDEKGDVKDDGGHTQERSMASSAGDVLENFGLHGGTGAMASRLKTGLGVFMGSVQKDDDAASIRSQPPVPSKPKKPEVHDDLHRSVETLVRFLPDRRVKLAAALAAVGITPANQAHEIAPLSATSVEDLYALPDAAMSQLTPEQLLRYAQIVDTALFKSYLAVRPILAGSLFRVPNWCEVEEVEEVLRTRGMFRDLKDLYHQKKMHRQALQLLRQLGEKEDDVDERLYDTIQYLRKLGPEYLDQIFESARWVFEQDPKKALEIFKSDDVELPRQAVADYLENLDPMFCTWYLEYLIEELGDESRVFHNRLVQLYSKMTLSAKKRGDDRTRKDMYAKLLHFIDTTDHYSVDELYGLLSSEDLFEARAILLGKLGRHDQALELYVYHLHDYRRAEEYCKRYHQAGTPTGNVFLILLRIYLRPTVKTSHDLLQPALDLICRHSPRLDTVEALQLLPPLVTLQDVRTFLIEGSRIPVFDTHVVKQISRARNDQLARKLMALQTRRVKVTDSRICPQCHKRIGNSVIAVHSPRGEVTHYQCREAFSRKLNLERR